MNRLKKYLKTLYKICITNNISLASAGLAYYLSMTIFPVLICLYALLGNNIDYIFHLLEYLNEIVPTETIDTIKTFLNYVKESYSPNMLVMALSVIFFTASAGFRTLVNTIGDMQGNARYKGWHSLLASVIMALMFVATIYGGILLIFAGKAVKDFLLEIFNINIKISWISYGYILFFLMGLILMILIYYFCRSRKVKYPILPGALIGTIGLISVSWVFSLFISKSVKYPVIYGSVSSLILVLFYLFCCAQSIYIGAAVNIAHRTTEKEKNQIR